MPTPAQITTQDKGKGPLLEDDTPSLGPYYDYGSGLHPDDTLALCSVARPFPEAQTPASRKSTEEILGQLITIVQNLAHSFESQQQKMFALRPFVAIQTENLQD